MPLEKRLEKDRLRQEGSEERLAVALTAIRIRPFHAILDKFSTVCASRGWWSAFMTTVHIFFLIINPVTIIYQFWVQREGDDITFKDFTGSASIIDVGNLFTAQRVVAWSEFAVICFLLNAVLLYFPIYYVAKYGDSVQKRPIRAGSVLQEWVATIELLGRFSMFRFLAYTRKESVSAWYLGLRQRAIRVEQQVWGWLVPVAKVMMYVFGMLLLLLFIAVGILSTSIKATQLIFAVEPYQDWTASNWVALFTFVNQIGGMVDVVGFQKIAVFKFLFAGEDAKFQKEELLTFDDFQSAIVSRLFMDHRLSGLFFFAQMSTETLQKMVIDIECMNDGECAYDPPAAAVSETEDNGGIALTEVELSDDE